MLKRMSSYYQYYFNRPEYENILDFQGDSMSVTNNLIVKSNVSCQNLTCCNIFQSNLISTNIYASNSIHVASNITIGTTRDSNASLSILNSNMTVDSGIQMVIGNVVNSNAYLKYYKGSSSLFNFIELGHGNVKTFTCHNGPIFNNLPMTAFQTQCVFNSNVFINNSNSLYIGNSYPITDSTTRLSVLDSNLPANASVRFLLGQGSNTQSNASLSFFRATNPAFNVASLSCGVNSLALYGGSTPFNGGSYSILNSQIVLQSNVYMRSNLKVGYTNDFTPSLFNCDVNGSLNVSSNFMCSNATSVGLFSCSNIISSSNLTCSNITINGALTLPNIMTVNTLTVNSNLTCDKPATIRGVYVKDVFNENVSSMFRVTDTQNIDYIVSKNQCITNTLKYSKIIGIYDPLLNSTIPGGLTLDITTIIDTDGKIPFSVIKNFDQGSEGVAIGSMALAAIATLLGLGAIGLSVWSAFFNSAKTNGGVPLPGAEGPPGDQGIQGERGENGAAGVSIFLVTTQGENLKIVLTDTTVFLIPFTSLFNNPSFDTAVQRVINSTSLQGPTYDVGNIRERGVESIRSSINTVRNTTQTAATNAQNAVRNGLRSGGRVLGNIGRAITNPVFETDFGPFIGSAESSINTIAPG